MTGLAFLVVLSFATAATGCTEGGHEHCALGACEAQLEADFVLVWRDRRGARVAA